MYVYVYVRVRVRVSVRVRVRARAHVCVRVRVCVCVSVCLGLWDEVAACRQCPTAQALWVGQREALSLWHRDAVATETLSLWHRDAVFVCYPNKNCRQQRKHYKCINIFI